jgi:hypothetical protein
MTISDAAIPYDLRTIAKKARKRGEIMEMSRRLGRNIYCATLAILSFAALGAAQAQVTDAQKSAIRSNCRSDFMSKCSGVTPGGHEALECLQKNLATLAPGCKAAVSAIAPPPAPAEAKTPPAAPPPPPATAAAPPPPPAVQPAPPPSAAPAPQPPSPPAAAAPPPSPPAAPAPKQTAAPPLPAVAPAPASYSTAKIEKLRLSERLQIVRACDADRQAVCRGVEAGGSRIVLCLANHAEALSPVCRNAMEPLLAAPAAPPPQPAEERPFTRGAALIAKACARYIALHCAGVAPGGGREAECLVDYVKSGKFVGPRCREVLKLTGHLP